MAKDLGQLSEIQRNRDPFVAMNIFLINVNDSKRIWNGIKQIVHFKPATSKKIINIVKDNVEVTDPEVISDAFNDYFANIATNLAKAIPKV